MKSIVFYSVFFSSLLPLKKSAFDRVICHQSKAELKHSYLGRLWATALLNLIFFFVHCLNCECDKIGCYMWFVWRREFKHKMDTLQVCSSTPQKSLRDSKPSSRVPSPCRSDQSKYWETSINLINIIYCRMQWASTIWSQYKLKSCTFTEYCF